jgi:hypothetical protein
LYFVWQMAAANVEAPAAVAAVEMPGGDLSHEQVKLAVDGMIVEDLEHPICLQLPQGALHVSLLPLREIGQPIGKQKPFQWPTDASRV